MTWAHIVSRGIEHMRWDLDNALCLCWNEFTGEGCHPYFTSHPKEWKEFLFSYIGKNKYWELIRRKNDSSLVHIDKNKIKYLLQKEAKRLNIKI